VPSFKLLTFNIYGLPVLSSRRRLQTLAHEVADLATDVACLQEVQQYGYLRLVLEHTPSYDHHAFEPFVYAPMGGLMTLARAPIEHSEYMLYRDRGPLFSTEWPLHKGALLVRLQHEGRPIVVLNTHLFLNVTGDWRPSNRSAQIELGQVQQLAEVVMAQPSDALVIVCGDFNFPRGCFLYDELLARSGLTDPLSGDTRPTWHAPSPLLKRFELPLDLILLRQPDWSGLRAREEIVFDTPRPLSGGGKAFLSDHYALLLTLEWDE
jgi:endonuclease/exonuclease/phosphatase family metal-dependent hydrolase